MFCLNPKFNLKNKKNKGIDFFEFNCGGFLKKTVLGKNQSAITQFSETSKRHKIKFEG